MSRNGRSLKAGERVRVGRRTISVPSVPSMSDLDPPSEVSAPAGDSDRQPAIDPSAVQYLDPVRAIFRPTSSDNLAPGLERFIGREDIFRHVGEADTASHGAQAMMQCSPHWPRRHLGADPRSGNFGDTGRSGHSGGLIPDLLGIGRAAGLRMIRKRRLPGAGERVKVGRRLITVPGVASMTDPNSSRGGDEARSRRVGEANR